MPNSDVSHVSDCVFYDAELKELRSTISDAYKCLKRIEKRAERRQTIQMSRSLFDYVERRNTRARVPQSFFDFIYDDYRISIFYYQGKYSVLCVGFECLDCVLRITKYYGVGNLYGAFDRLEECLSLFCYVIDYFINRVLKYNYLNLDDVPF